MRKLLAALAVATVACGGGEPGGREQAQAGEAQPCEPAAQPCAPAQAELPPGVTATMLEEGKTLFGGQAICMACHGPNGEGIEGLGANLTDSEWLYSDGSFESIVQTVTSGVEASESSTGTAMPPKGGANISDEQVRAVAAYVWSLSH